MKLPLSPMEVRERRLHADGTPAQRFWEMQEARARSYASDKTAVPAEGRLIDECVRCLDLAFAAAVSGDAALSSETSAHLETFLRADEKKEEAFLYNGMTASHLTLIYGILQADISIQLETMLRAALEKRARALEQFIPRTWKRWNSLHSNFGVVVGGGLAAAALALDDDRTAARLETALETLKIFLSYYYRPDGGAPEGSHYWFYATLHGLIAHHIILRATGRNILDWGFLLRTGRYGIALHSHETTPLHRHLRLHDTPENSFVSSSIPLRLGLLTADPVLLSYWRKMYLREPVNQWQTDWSTPSHANGVHRVVDHILTLVWLEPQALEGPDEPLPKTMFFPDHGDLMLRTGWEKTDTFVHLHACRFAAELFNWHHHRDHGHFTVQAGGEFLAADSGVTAYDRPEYQEWYCATVSHNCITLEGADQLPPRLIPFHRFASNDAIEYFGLELYFAYARVPCWRRLIFLRPDLLILLDDIKSEKTAWWQLHAPESASVAANAADCSVTGVTMRLAIRFLVPQPPCSAVLKSPKHTEDEKTHEILRVTCPEAERGPDGRQIFAAVMAPHSKQTNLQIEQTPLELSDKETCRAWRFALKEPNRLRTFILISNFSTEKTHAGLLGLNKKMRDCISGETIAPETAAGGLTVAAERERLFIVA